MRVLVACERSGVVRSAFRCRGHEAYSCDILPSTYRSTYHIQADVLTVLEDGWDLIIAHPPCTHLCSSGARHFESKRQLQQEALDFVFSIWQCSVPKLCIENPVGVLSSLFKKPSQVIQPYQFGHDASKSTCLWLRGVDLLKPTKTIRPKQVSDKHYRVNSRWGNQSPCGADSRGPSTTRGFDRAITYSGIASAMADQWGEQ